MKTGPNIRKRVDGRFEARYIKSRTPEGKIIYGFCYGKTYEEAKEKRRNIIGPKNEPEQKPERQMNLLILGAGDHGMVVREVAEELRIFDNISFLDDNPEKKIALDVCGNYKKYQSEYPMAFVSFGDNELRYHWIKKLEEAGFILPRLIHRQAFVSPSAKIGKASIIEAKATVNANVTIGDGCLISSGAIVDLGAVLEDCCHIDCGALVKEKSRVMAKAKIF